MTKTNEWPYTKLEAKNVCEMVYAFVLEAKSRVEPQVREETSHY